MIEDNNVELFLRNLRLRIEEQEQYIKKSEERIDMLLDGMVLQRKWLADLKRTERNLKKAAQEENEL